jgi:hypothetical protein
VFLLPLRRHTLYFIINRIGLRFDSYIALGWLHSMQSKSASTLGTISKLKPNVASSTCCSGHKSLQGLRPYMEDCHFILPQFFSVTDGDQTDQKSSPAFHFFGICDGHGGAQVAQRCAQSIPRHLREELSIISSQLALPDFRQQVLGVSNSECSLRRSHEGRLAHPIERAMVAAFEAADKDLREDAKLAEEAKWMGTTALAVLVDNQHIWIANCGACCTARVLVGHTSTPSLVLDAACARLLTLLLLQGTAGQCYREPGRASR